MNTIRASFLVDTVVTHTAPSHCELCSKSNLNQWAKNDPLLLDDVQSERHYGVQSNILIVPFRV